MMCLSMIEEQARAVTRATRARGNDYRFEIPLHIKNGCNLREHWAARAKRVKKERNMVGWALLGQRTGPRGELGPSLPVVVTLTRLAPRQLDSDNCVAGFKGVRDSIAEFLGVNDNDPRVTWRYAQEKAKGYSCKIEITEAGACT
jgi:hypothetical protein